MGLDDRPNFAVGVEVAGELKTYRRARSLKDRTAMAQQERSGALSSDEEAAGHEEQMWQRQGIKRL